MSAEEDDKAEREAYIRGAKDAVNLLIEVAEVASVDSLPINGLRLFYYRIERGEWPPKENA